MFLIYPIQLTKLLEQKIVSINWLGRVEKCIAFVLEIHCYSDTNVLAFGHNKFREHW